MDQEVQWLLAEKLLHVRISRTVPWADVISNRSRILTAFNSTLEALRYVNAISEEESVQWRDKMWRTIGLDPPGPAEPGKIRLVYLGEGEPPQPDHESLIPRYPRRIGGPHETVDAFGGRLRIDEVEYDDSVTLIRWHMSPVPDADAAFPELAAALAADTVGMDQWAVEHFRVMNREELWRLRIPRFELEDDVGTEYSHHPISGGGVTGSDIKGYNGLHTWDALPCRSSARQLAGVITQD